MTSTTSKNSPVRPACDEEFIRLEEVLEHLRIMLSVEMKDLRSCRGLTQAQLAERLGCNQSWVSKVENAENNTGIESILRYLFALDANLVLGVLDNEQFLPVTEAAEKWWEKLEGGLRPLGEYAASTRETTDPARKLAKFEPHAKESASNVIRTEQVPDADRKVVG